MLGYTSCSPNPQPINNGSNKNDSAPPSVINNNVISPSQRSGCCNSCRACETGELIRDGGFELFSAASGRNFAYWNQSALGFNISHSSSSYEGDWAALFDAEDNVTNRVARLSQNVIVTPGCRYKLSFAENITSLAADDNGPTFVSMTARVFYTKDMREFDLIKIQIPKNDKQAHEGKGYVLHQKVMDIPVPCDVTGVIVEFLVETSSDTEIRTSWLLDEVSLRAVSSGCSDCCC